MSGVGHRRPLRLLVTVTLNPNQLRAHLAPILALEEVEAVKLVADVPGPMLPKLETVVPPPWLRRTFGRAGSKLLTAVRLARRDPPDVVIGYNLVPHGINAAIVSLLTRVPAVYHMIGGAEEWLGGGWRSDNNVLRRLRHRSRVMEWLLLRFVRRFAVVATMGPCGRAELMRRGVPGPRIVELPAAVDDSRFKPEDSGGVQYDVVSITSLLPRKRPWDIVAVLARVRGTHPELRAAIVGEGPLAQDVRRLLEDSGLDDAVHLRGFDPEPERILQGSRVFLLASRYEGLSIAMAEAMATGVPPVVTRVGEAESLVSDGENGYLWEVGDIATAADRVRRLLDDEALRRRMGEAAARTAQARAGFSTIVAGSRELLERAINNRRSTDVPRGS